MYSSIWSYATPAQIEHWTQPFWLLLVAVWMGGWLFAKQPAYRPSLPARVAHLPLLAAGFYLLFGPLSPQPSIPFLHAGRLTAMIGLVGVGLGIMFAIWARFTLADNWSAAAEIKQRHELVVRGPYRFVRHPIYAGLLLALFATALQQGTYRGFLAAFLCLSGLRIKISDEEHLMMHQFGEQYRHYQSKVGALLPFVR